MRDQPGTTIRYIAAGAPTVSSMRTYAGEFTHLVTFGELPGDTAASYKARRERVLEARKVTIEDARTDGRLAEWQFDTHGFVAVDAPPPITDFRDRGLVRRDYAPALAALARQATGARHALLMGSQVRDEVTGRGTGSASYARFAHSDYGPEYGTLLRPLLVTRYGLDADYAAGCGLCAAGFWAPIDRPAYQDPLCLLDASSVDLARDTVRYIYQGELGYASTRPASERMPAAAQDAPAIAPRYSPAHRWLYAPDMQPAEGWLFKQYDWREAASARACWHASFRDRHHDGWSGCPGRRSIECRLLLVFD